MARWGRGHDGGGRAVRGDNRSGPRDAPASGDRNPHDAKLTFIVQLSSVFAEAFQPHTLAQQVQELLEGRPGRLVVVHLLLRALARPAVQDPDLVLEAQLQCETRSYSAKWVGRASCSKIKTTEGQVLFSGKYAGQFPQANRPDGSTSSRHEALHAHDHAGNLKTRRGGADALGNRRGRVGFARLPKRTGALRHLLGNTQLWGRISCVLHVVMGVTFQVRKEKATDLESCASPLPSAVSFPCRYLNVHET